MNIVGRWGLPATVVALFAIGLVADRCDGLTVVQSGYIAEVYKSLPQSGEYNDIEIDASGNIYVASCGAGVLKVDPAKVVTPWSSAPVCDVTVASSGPQFGAGRGNCNCVEAFAPDGTYVPLRQDGLAWTWVAKTFDGVLYANVWLGAGQGLYAIDTATGQIATVVSGGPGPGGAGFYFGMAGGTDGKLYALGHNGSSFGLFRLDGSTFSLAAPLPNGGANLAEGANGTFLTNTQYDSPGGLLLGELWMMDPTLGTSSLLATSDNDGSNLGMDCVAYDGSTKTIYVLEGYRIWTIRKDPTPAVSDSWGSLKARYRR